MMADVIAWLVIIIGMLAIGIPIGALIYILTKLP